MAIMVAGCTSSLTEGYLARPSANEIVAIQTNQHRVHRVFRPDSDLLYVAPSGPNLVTYYTYPAGTLIGTLNATARGLCSDAKGNVFVVGDGSITEFAHGGTKPINTLGNASYNYWSCSVDPTSGDLAVTFENYSARRSRLNHPAVSNTSGGTGIAIFKNASGSQITYTDADFSHLYYCGYDGSSNLFADGYIGGAPAAFAELPVGSHSLKTVLLTHELKKPGQVQWDGKHITLADEHNRKVYRIEIKGSTASVLGTTKLGGLSSAYTGSWIYNAKAIVPFVRHGVGYIGYWKYPRGGHPTKSFEGPGYDTVDNAVTVSAHR